MAVTKISEIFADNFRWIQHKLLILIVNHSQSSLIASFCSSAIIKSTFARTLHFFLGIDWLESQTTNGLNCSHSACFLRNSADYNPLLHAAAPPDLLFQLCKWQKSEIIVLLSPETRSSPQRPTHGTWVRDVHPWDEVHSFLHFFIHFFISSFISSN